MEKVISNGITQKDIVDAIEKMLERDEYPNTITMNPEMFYHIRTLPGYSEHFLYGIQIIDNEMGTIEGLVIQVVPNFGNSIYVHTKPINKKINFKWD